MNALVKQQDQDFIARFLATYARLANGLYVKTTLLV